MRVISDSFPSGLEFGDVEKRGKGWCFERRPFPFGLAAGFIGKPRLVFRNSEVILWQYHDHHSNHFGYYWQWGKWGRFRMKFDAKKVVERLKEHYGITEDAELAEFLGIHKQKVYNWKKRNTTDLEVILAKCRDVDLNWLFRGTPFEGSKELADLRTRLEALEKKIKP